MARNVFSEAESRVADTNEFMGRVGQGGSAARALPECALS
jgi:hypothetical protein